MSSKSTSVTKASLTRVVSNMAVNALLCVLLRFKRSFVPLRLYSENEPSLVRFVFDEGVVIVNFGAIITARLANHFGGTTIAMSLNGNDEVEAIPVESSANAIIEIKSVFIGFPSRKLTDSLISLIEDPRAHLSEQDIENALDAKIIPTIEEETSIEDATWEDGEDDGEDDGDSQNADDDLSQTNNEEVETSFKRSAPNSVSDDERPRKSAKISMLLMDKLKISTELSTSSLDALLSLPCPPINPVRQAVMQPTTIDMKYSGAEFKLDTKEALLTFHKFCHAALHFQDEEADNGISMEKMTARFIIGHLQNPAFSMVKNQEEAKSQLNSIPAVLRFIKEELFGELLVQGIDNIAFQAVKGSSNVDVEVNTLKNLLSFFPDTTIGKSKKLLISMFEGWPLQNRLKEYILHKSIEDSHVSFSVLAELAINAGRQQEMRPKKAEVHNVSAQTKCDICSSGFVPQKPFHTKCSSCFAKQSKPAVATKCRECGANWLGVRKTIHNANCSLQKK